MNVKVTVKRSEWYRGMGNGSKMVLRDYTDGEKIKRCCLGFAGLAYGFTDEEMFNLSTPASVLSSFPNKDAGVFDNLVFTDHGDFTNNSGCSTLMNINDDQEITEQRREEELIIEGARVGIDFEFVD